MADKTYVVTAACAMVKVGDRLRTVLQGGVLPAGADPDHVKLLVSRGIVEEGGLVGGVGSDPNVPAPFVVPAEKADRKPAAEKADA